MFLSCNGSVNQLSKEGCRLVSCWALVACETASSGWPDGITRFCCRGCAGLIYCRGDYCNGLFARNSIRLDLLKEFITLIYRASCLDHFLLAVAQADDVVHDLVCVFDLV